MSAVLALLGHAIAPRQQPPQARFTRCATAGARRRRGSVGDPGSSQSSYTVRVDV